MTRDNELEELLAAAVEEAGAEPSGCPPAEELWAAAHGELAATDVGAVARHVATCRRCRVEWEVASRARRLSPEGDVVKEPASIRPFAAPLREVPSGRRRPTWRLPAAAAALLAVALFLGRGVFFSPQPVYLGPGDELTIQAVSGASGPRGQDLSLEWRLEPPIEDALFEVTVSYLLETVFHTEETIEENQVTVPWDVLRDLPPGATLQWSVTARHAGGLERADFVVRIE